MHGSERRPLPDARQDRTGTLTARRRAQIRRIAGEQFAEYGYQGASLRQVAAASGLAPGHLYYYYPSKQDLLNDVITVLQEQFNASMDAAVAASGPSGDVLRALLVDHVTILCSHIIEATVSYESLRFLTVEHRVGLVAARDAYEAGLRSLIDELRTVRPIATTPTPLLAKVVLGIVNWPYQWYRPDGAQSVDNLAAALAERAMASLRSG